jgi:hypothetical protein
MKRALLAVAVSGCGTPTPQLLLGLAGPPTQECPSTTECEKIPLPCDAVMSIRMIEPGDPSRVYHEQCTAVPSRTPNDACSLDGVDLQTGSIPVRKLEVQVAVFSASTLQVDAMNQPVCPVVEFSADGFPIGPPTPTLGGRTYYKPGDTSVNVKLGCTDLLAVGFGETCGSPAGSITATVDDFDNQLPVSGGPDGVANALWVSVGEPHVLEGMDVLGPLDTVPLRLQGGDPPMWSVAASRTFAKNACVEVVEDVAQTTPSLRCQQAPAAGAAPMLKGMRIAKPTLDNVLSSLGFSRFPEDGLTVGIVLDTLSRGASDYVVSAPNATVRYLSPSGALGGTTTSATGIFVSVDAPFGTLFSASGASATVPAVGGLVAGKVTLVIVPFADLRRAPAPPVPRPSSSR